MSSRIKQIIKLAAIADIQLNQEEISLIKPERQLFWVSFLENMIEDNKKTKSRVTLKLKSDIKKGHTFQQKLVFNKLIVDNYRRGSVTMRQLANKYEVSAGTINNIINS